MFEISLYSLLPLIAFLSNIILGLFILFRNPKNKLNILYSLVTFSWALWALGDFLVFTASSPIEALNLSKIATIGASLNAILVIHFFLVFTKSKMLSNKKFYSLYLVSLYFIFFTLSTNLISEGAISSWWGYHIIRGILYLPFTSYISGYVIFSIFFAYKYFKGTKSEKEKKLIKILIIATIIPLTGGILSQVIPQILGFEFIRLTTTLTTISAVFIAYSVLKHRLLSITPNIAAKKVLDIMEDYLILVDENKKICYINNLVIKLLGYKKVELVGKPLSIIISDNKKNIEFVIYKNIKEKSYMRNYETIILTKTKRKIPVSINGSVLKDNMGNIIGYILIMRDMIETNKLIFNLREKTLELEKSEKRLKKSLNELKKTDTEKNEFISIAAHELKTPMAAIHGFSQLLKNKSICEDSKRREKYLKIIESETNRLSKMVTDILDLSRVDLGTLKLALDDVNINDVIEEVKNELYSEINKRGLKLVVKKDPKIPVIKTDEEKVKRVLINLIGNSIKYTEKGSIEVMSVKDRNRIIVTISDTGIGIPKKDFKNIFKRFFQVESTYTRKIKGTGLGLSISKELVETMGGKMWFESKNGKGSAFHFMLPIKRK
ncbi:MAG: ATP-binding protein [Candidatus Aenigmatarchaeota archaeon]